MQKGVTKDLSRLRTNPKSATQIVVDTSPGSKIPRVNMHPVELKTEKVQKSHSATKTENRIVEPERKLTRMKLPMTVIASPEATKQTTNNTSKTQTKTTTSSSLLKQFQVQIIGF